MYFFEHDIAYGPKMLDTKYPDWAKHDLILLLFNSETQFILVQNIGYTIMRITRGIQNNYTLLQERQHYMRNNFIGLVGNSIVGYMGLYILGNENYAYFDMKTKTSKLI